MRVWLFIFVNCFSNLLTAQIQVPFSDTLKIVEIHETKKNNPDHSEQKTDTLLMKYYRFEPVQNLLQLYSNVYIKNYGLSNFSTLSIRGSSAAQTSVLWNGININNALTGMSDLSLIGTQLFDEIRIHYGATDGSGLAGGLTLGNKPVPFKNAFRAQAGLAYESLGNIRGGFKVMGSGRRIANTLKINFATAQNRYEFFNTEIQKPDTLLHARSKQWSLAYDVSADMGSTGLISFHHWTQETRRQIPPASFEYNSEKNESIFSSRNLLKWESVKNSSWNAEAGVGVLYENYSYHDSMINLHSDAQVMQLPVFANMFYRFQEHHKLGVQLHANRSAMQQPVKQSLYQMNASLSYSISGILKRSTLNILLQQEYSNLFRVKAGGSVSLSTRIIEGCYWYQSVAIQNRVPTLNELYYTPGGNPGLKPERSANLETGATIDKTWVMQTLHFDAALYARNVKDWILWYGNAILTPHNIQEVYSRGLECHLHYTMDLRKKQVAKTETELVKKSKTPLQITSGIFYAYTLSTTQNSDIPNDASIDKQIPYVPRYQFKYNLGIRSAAFDLQYIFTYTGYRFVTTDESQWLMPYSASHLMGSVNRDHGRNTIRIQARVNNLLNTHYESIVGRVMPGRTFSVGVLWSRI